MRIAQVAPLFESVPPKLYGGTERVVSYLTEELVNQGHDVTLFASGDSTTKAQLCPGSRHALRLGGTSEAQAKLHAAMLHEVHALRRHYDVIHLHVDDWHLLEPRLLDTPHVTTVHGRLDVPHCRKVYENRPDLTLVSISNSQRAGLYDANWLSTVYHGIPEDLYRPSAERGDYLVFLGRISQEKRVDRAVDIAGRYGLPLKIAAKVDNADYAYYETVKHKLREPWVDFIGEVGEPEKLTLLRGARALLFPIDWPEPFGLAMIEAMLCGTPVIAWRHGSIPEVVDDGITGMIVDSIEGAVSALRELDHMDRAACAEHARKRFSARRMAEDYVRVYKHRAIQHLRARSLVHGESALYGDAESILPTSEVALSTSDSALMRGESLVRSERHAEPGE
jgi:glycosyltransferase involved in cell wall biosynthesis